jgi:hypothetical protein
MKARMQWQHQFERAFGGPSHLLALADGRAVVLSRYSRRVARIAADAVDIIALDPEGETTGDLFDRRGAPFALGDGFAVAFSDRLALFEHFDAAPRVLPLRFEDAARRLAVGRLEPLLACALGPDRAALGLHARALSIHSAARVVELTWNEREAVVVAGERWFYPATVADADAGENPADAAHPQVIRTLSADRDGILRAQSTGPARRHARYGMAWCAVGGWDASARPIPATPVVDGYGQFDGDRLWLRVLDGKAGGLDFACCAPDGTPLAALRITKKALLPLEDQWLESGFGRDDLWFGDDLGRIARFRLDPR